MTYTTSKGTEITREAAIATVGEAAIGYGEDKVARHGFTHYCAEGNGSLVWIDK